MATGEVSEGDIVQIVDTKHHWFPCLVIVTEKKSFGVQGYVTIPRNDGEPCDNAFIRLKHEAFEPVGAKAIIAAA